jgi:hypothetical protein
VLFSKILRERLSGASVTWWRALPRYEATIRNIVA